MSSVTSNETAQLTSVDINSAESSVRKESKDPYPELHLQTASMKTSAGIIKPKPKHIPKITTFKRGGQTWLRITPRAPKFRVTVYTHRGMHTTRIEKLNTGSHNDGLKSPGSTPESSGSDESDSVDGCDDHQRPATEPLETQGSSDGSEKINLVLPFRTKAFLS